MLILVRHGQSEANAAGVLSGRADSPLTPLGREQAGRIGRLLRAGPAPVRIVTSPLTRARTTAEIVHGVLGPGAPVPQVDERLIELDYGELEGKRPSELGTLWPSWRSDPSWRPPGGESFLELHRRLEPLWSSLASSPEGGDVVAVTHVSPIKAAVAFALGTGPELAWKLSLGVASVTRIRLDGPAAALVSFGETGHLVDS